MKRTAMLVAFVLLASLVFGFVTVQPLLAATRIVELNVPGCG